MSRYRRAKESLIEQVRSQLERDAGEVGEPKTPRLEKSLRYEAAGIVDEFERLAAMRSHWHGVWQSFIGSCLFALIPGAIYLVYLGTRHDFWSSLFGK